MTPTEYLCALPEPIQAELVRLVRAGAGMSQDERADFLAGACGVVEAFIEHRPQTAALVSQLFDAVGQALAEIDRAAFPRSEEVTT